MMLRLTSLICIGFFVFILWIIYLANTGQQSIFFDLVKQIPYGDKLGHIIIFALLTFSVNLATRLKIIVLGPVKFFVGSLLVSLFAFGEELSQYFYPSRTLDIYDLIANIAGISLSSLFCYFMKSKPVVPG